MKNHQQRTTTGTSTTASATDPSTASQKKSLLYKIFDPKLRAFLGMIFVGVANVLLILAMTIFPVHTLADLTSSSTSSTTDRSLYGSASSSSGEQTSRITSNRSSSSSLSQEELLLSPTRVTLLEPATQNETDWDHFADFQEDLADETAPRASFYLKSQSTLDTLEETEEEEEGDEDDVFCF